MVTIEVSEQEFHTIQAALRVYERFGIEAGLSSEIEDLATNGGQVDLLMIDGIDALCERINFDDTRAPVDEALRRHFATRTTYGLHKANCKLCLDGMGCQDGNALFSEAIDLAEKLRKLLAEESKCQSIPPG